MAPTEGNILSNYLTIAAKLPAIISLEQFTAFFPKSQQSNPQIRTLYRHLQHQRNITVDTVTENIEAEERHGRALRRETARARREAAEHETDPELQIENAVSLSKSTYSSAQATRTLRGSTDGNTVKRKQCA